MHGFKRLPDTRWMCGRAVAKAAVLLILTFAVNGFASAAAIRLTLALV